MTELNNISVRKMAKLNGDMELSNNEELLEAQAQVWNQTFSFIHTMSLKCAIDLGIPDIIHRHGTPMSLSQLVDTLPINKVKAHCIRRLMRLLVQCKVFDKLEILDKPGDEEVHYWLTPAGRLLLRDDPISIAPYLQVISNPVMMKTWHHMSEWLVNGHEGSAFEVAHGISIWEYFDGDEPRLANLFNESMACDTRLVMSVVLKDYKQVFEGVGLLVDVGGGIGTATKEIHDVFPGMECVVLDLPQVVAGLKGTHNLTFVGGDMFDDIPRGDAILFKWVLHDWNDESCARILKKCREAVTEGGKVIIFDVVLKDDGQGDNNKIIEEAQLLFDMAMMAYVNGKERSEREWAKLFTDAGFTTYKISPVLGVRSVIEVYP
ncbi:8-hydroxyquercetin 8-O-methyltransferase-like [Andrographis paniculata]|uniref:8-hydroxyquercetin 8-O-methyltransferase-like n=1 Tax=Andrographis paniculata TaxID=175694 RepID=UPI0021E884D6|nr:8-hydroxyquercetin 8-O-methyltransferase-like [Andrographis paniculata]